MRNPFRRSGILLQNSQKENAGGILQKRFNYVLGEKNSRQAKANGNYYLLLHVKPPIAIVECGFLSNRAEAAKLQDEVYQDRMAWTVHMGIMEFLNRDFAGYHGNFCRFRKNGTDCKSRITRTSYFNY